MRLRFMGGDEDCWHASGAETSAVATTREILQCVFFFGCRFSCLCILLLLLLLLLDLLV
jgi:hypothetical protein